jgi:hypothetical protein
MTTYGDGQHNKQSTAVTGRSATLASLAAATKHGQQHDNKQPGIDEKQPKNGSAKPGDKKPDAAYPPQHNMIKHDTMTDTTL